MPSPEGARIIIDSSPLRYLHTGLGQFTYHLLEELVRIDDPATQYQALVHPVYSGRVPPGMSWIPAHWLRRHAPSFIQAHLYPSCDVWHMTTENTRLTGIPGSARVLLTIHGLHFMDELPTDEASRELAHVQSLVNRAEAIAVVSRTTEALVRKLLNLGSRSIEVIPNGVAKPSVQSRKPAWAPPGKFLFTVGTFFARKNYQVLIPMMEHLPDFELVIAGDMHTDFGREIRSRVEAAGMGSRVHLPGEIPEEEKRWLFENGVAYLFPSVSEGFGIPVIEAFLCGMPVFCSRYGSLPEVGGDHAFYWDQFDPQAMATTVSSKLAVESSALRSARVTYADAFTWERTAMLYRSIYRSLL